MTSPSRHPKTLFICSGFFIAAAIIATLFFLTRDVEELRDTVRDILEVARGSPWSFPIVCGLYLLASLVMFPIIVMNLATALVFGPVYGTLYALSGTLLAGTTFFLVGRFGRERGLKTYLQGPKIRRLDEKLKESGVIGITILRLIPMAPFGIFNMVAGITSLRFIDYIAGTFLAFWPGGIARAVVGDSLVQLILAPSRETFIYLVCGAILWAAVVLGLHFGLKKYRQDPT